MDAFQQIQKSCIRNHSTEDQPAGENKKLHSSRLQKYVYVIVKNYTQTVI